MAITQDNRILSISSKAFPKDELLLESFKAVEGISELFRIEAKCLKEEDEYSGAAPSYIKPQSLLSKGVHIRVKKPDGKIRHFNGIVTRISQGSRRERFTDYTLEIRPEAWLLTQVRRSRIFQNKSTREILEAVLKTQLVANARDEIKRNYCVQYRESDWDFASRLMEEDGIYYYFKHDEWGHKLVVSDDPTAHDYCPDQKTIEFRSKISNPEGHASSIGTWHVDHQLQTGKVTLWDHHFVQPNRNLESTQNSVHAEINNSALESYDYPGGYARLSDINPSPADNGHLPYSKVRMEELDARYMTTTGTGDACGMTAGHRFTLQNHPNDEFNRNYVVTRTVHQATQTPTYVSDEIVSTPYINSFACIAQGEGTVSFRPERKTPKPIVHGSQTAWVVGNKGEGITTDEHGRVKVQFHWDREGKVDQDSSCWIRVQQSWAGRQFGTMFIPRVGMQVVVDFFEGDPDQPIITGCIHNADAKPAYTLPEHKTRSYIKTNSDGYDAKGSNEIRFEDQGGKEQIFIHAEKNEDIRVRKDCKETIEQDRHLFIKRDQIEKVERDKHLLVKGDQTEKVDGNVHLNVGSSKEQKTGSKFAVDAGTEIHLRAATSAVIEAGQSLTLKVGGNSVAINSGGVFIKGTMVHLNSMAAAVSGSGSNPNSPKEPLEADTSNPGKSGGKLPSGPPPKAPGEYEKMAAEARARALAAIPPQSDVEIITCILTNLQNGYGITHSSVTHKAIVSRLSPEEQEYLLDAYKYKKNSYFHTDENAIKFWVQRALDGAEKETGKVKPEAPKPPSVPGKFEFPRGPSVPEPVVKPEVKPEEEKPKNYSVYGQDEEKATNYQVMDKDGEVKDVGEKAPDPLPSKQREDVEEKDAGEKAPAANYQPYREGEDVEEKDAGERAPQYSPSKQHEDVEEKDVGEKTPAANYQPYREGEGIDVEEEKEIGKQAVSMVDAAKDGVPYVAYTGGGWNG